MAAGHPHRGADAPQTGATPGRPGVGPALDVPGPAADCRRPPASLFFARRVWKYPLLPPHRRWTGRRAASLLPAGERTETGRAGAALGGRDGGHLYRSHTPGAAAGTVSAGRPLFRGGRGLRDGPPADPFRGGG